MRDTILLLGGNSPGNADWAEKLARFYIADYKVVVVRYESWKNSTEIDFDIEMSKLATESISLSNCIVIAKSAGILLALRAVEQKVLTPSILIALGTPLKYAEHRGLEIEGLYSTSRPIKRIATIQQRNDPQGTATSVGKILPVHAEKHVIPGNDHQYKDLLLLNEVISKILS